MDSTMVAAIVMKMMVMMLMAEKGGEGGRSEVKEKERSS